MKCEKTSDENANPNNTSSDQRQKQLRDLCWDVCKKHYVESRQTKKKLLTRENLQKLWCIFNSVCETDDRDEPLIPVVVHKEELELIVKKMFASIDKILDANFSTEQMAFEEFVTLLEEDLLEYSQHAAIDCMVDVVYSEYILQIVKKVSFCSWVHESV